LLSFGSQKGFLIGAMMTHDSKSNSEGGSEDYHDNRQLPTHFAGWWRRINLLAMG
jgi:hypothetical protein